MPPIPYHKIHFSHYPSASTIMQKRSLTVLLFNGQDKLLHRYILSSLTDFNENLQRRFCYIRSSISQFLCINRYYLRNNAFFSISGDYPYHRKLSWRNVAEKTWRGKAIWEEQACIENNIKTDHKIRTWCEDVGFISPVLRRDLLNTIIN